MHRDDETPVGGNYGNYPDSIDGRLEQAKDVALGKHASPPSRIDELGEAAGGVSGVLVGAGIGSAAGPLGTLIGGIAGAIGGWWTGRAVAEAAERMTEDDETYYRSHYESQASRPADRTYDDVRGAYYLGYIASHNPNFLERQFTEVEPELERGWKNTSEGQPSWESVRGYAQEAYDRSRERRSRDRLAAQLEPHRPPGEERR